MPSCMRVSPVMYMRSSRFPAREKSSTLPITGGTIYPSGLGACLPGTDVTRTSASGRVKTCDCQVASAMGDRNPCLRSFPAACGSVMTGKS